MDAPSPPPPGSAEDLFADFLERLESGERVDFDALCKEHPDLAPSLRRIHLRWLAMTRAFGEFSRTTPQSAAGPPSAALDALLTRLRTGGARVDRYAIGAEIARGAMGRIVQAWDEELGREVALKVHRGAADDARMQRRFLEEAQIAAQLDHPGIVPIHELGIDAEGRPFFSMRLVRGADLGEILTLASEGKGDWTRTRVLHVLLRVCEAMAFAHSRGVVHRDLKPANIMVGRFHETYVMDWGLAHVRGLDGAGERGVESLRTAIAGEGPGSPLLTHHGDVIGTPAYMAPEQARGGSPVTEPTVDVYALGTILYHTLAGHMPFADGGTPTAEVVLQRVRSGPPRPLPHDVPPELRAICEKAMSRQPTDRYPTIADLGDDLRSYLEVRIVRAYATGRFAELRKWVARNRALTATVLALLLLGVVGTAAVVASWMRANATAARLRTELDRNGFRSARQSLQLGDSSEAGDALWRAHLEGRMPRATSWALVELAERDPYLVTVPIHRNNRAVAFATNLDAVLVADADGTLAVHDGTTLSLRTRLGDPGAALTAVTAPTDAAWAVAGNSNGELLVFDLGSGRVTRRETVHTGSVSCLVMTGTQSFASGGADGRVLWFDNPRAAARVMLEQPVAITALTAHPDGDGVVAGDEAGHLRGRSRSGRWSLDRGAASGQVTAVAFGVTTGDLWVGAVDHQLRHLDLPKGTDRVWPTRNGTYRQLARDRDGSLVAGGWWRTDHRAADGAVLSPVALRGISRFALDAERRLLATTGIAAGLGIVDLASRDRRFLAGQHSVALSADGRRVALGSGGRIEVRDVDTDQRIAELPATTGWSCLSPNGDLIAVASQQAPRVDVFETATGQLRFSCEGPSEAPLGEACAFRADGSELAVRVGDTHVRRLRCSDGEVIAEYERAFGRTICLAYSQDGRSLAVIGRGNATVGIHDLVAGTSRDEVFDPVLPTGVATTLSAVALSPDGSRIAVGTWQGGILVREADGSTTTIPAHAGTIWSLRFALRDPGLLITSGGSTGIAFFDLDTRECCYQTARDVAGQVQVSADGRTLACLLPDGVLLQDLSYRLRHVAGNLEYHLDRHRGKVEFSTDRERELRAWARETLSGTWPRWR